MKTKEITLKTRKRITRGLGLLICLIAFAIPALVQNYDLVIFKRPGHGP